MDEMRCNYKHTQIEKELEGIRHDIKELNDRMNALEKSTAVNEEQTKMVFKILNEIKDSIALIANKIDVLEKKPADRWEEVIKTVITVAATIAVTYFITKK